MMRLPFSKHSRLFIFMMALGAIVNMSMQNSQAQSSILKVGVYENVPIVFRDKDGNHMGLSIDVLDHVATKERWELEYVPCAWLDCLNLLKTGKIDIQVAIAQTKERTMMYDYTEEILFTAWGQIFSRPDSDIESLLDLEGKTVALYKGSLLSETFKDLTYNFDIKLTLIEVDGYTPIINLINEKKADAGVFNRTFAGMYSDTHGLSKTPVVFSPVHLYYAFTKGKNQEIRTALDRHLKNFKKDRTSVYYQSIDRFLGDKGEVIPTWTRTLATGIGLLLILVLANIVLRRTVRLKTVEIMEKNKSLEDEIIERKKAEGSLKDSREKYRSLVESLREDYYFYSYGMDCVFTYLSPSIKNVLGYTQEDFLCHYTEYLTDNPVNKDVVSRMELSIKGQQQPPYLVEIFHKDERIHWLEVTEFPNCDANGNVISVEGIAHDITGRIQAEQIVKKIANKISVKTGEEYFRSLVESIAQELGMDYAFIGELVPESNSVKTITIYAHGNIIENIEYDLQGTPCDNVVGKHACVYAQKIQEQFPEDKLLVKMAVDSYIGIPLFASDDRPLGLVVVMGCSPVEEMEKEKAVSLLQIFAARASSELDRRQAEKHLQEERDKVKDYLDISGVVMVVIDANLNVSMINKRGREVLGYGDDKIIGHNWFDNFLPIRFRDETKKVFTKLMKGDIEPVKHFENPVLTKSGEERMIAWNNSILTNDAGKIIGTLSSGEDITDRKKAEKALSISEEKFSKAFRSSPTLMSISTLDEGRFIDVNDSFLNVSGFSREDVVGHTSRELHMWVRPYARDKVTSELRTHGFVQNHEVEFRVKSGEVLTVLWSAELIEIKGNPCVLAVALNISDRKKLEGQLLHAQKMESIGTLAGGVAHDFNNILTAILGFSSILHRRMTKDDPLKHYVEQIQTASENAANLTSGLLTFSRKQKTNPTPQNVNEIIWKLEKFLLRIIGEDIEFKTKPADDRLMAMVDFSQIQQVLMNLAANARDAMPRGGSLTISAETCTIDHDHINSHGFGEPGQYALISISDTGSGMDEATRLKIFEPFFTTKEVSRGTGLGLSIVYGIIKQHGGYIHVDSEPGKGTTFRIYLPLIIETVKKVEDNRIKTSAPIGGTETILLAEDDTMIRQLITSVLSEYGYKVIDAVDGEDALNKFIENQDKIQFVVSDVIMPKKSGSILFEAIKGIRPDIKCLFLSGYSEELMNQRDILEKGMEVILKPIKPDALLNRIRELLDES